MLAMSASYSNSCATTCSTVSCPSASCAIEIAYFSAFDEASEKSTGQRIRAIEDRACRHGVRALCRHGQHGTTGFAQHLFGDRPEKKAFEPGSPMRADDEQIGVHAGRLFQDFAGRVAFANHGLNGDPGCALRLGECPGVGEQLIAIHRCQHNRLEDHRAGPNAATGAGENTWRAVTVDSYHRAIAMA